MRQVIVHELTKLDELSKSLRTSFFSTRATRYDATLLLLLCLGVGNAWGTVPSDTYYSISAPDPDNAGGGRIHRTLRLFPQTGRSLFT